MFIPPTHCPSCKTLLVLSKTKTDLICPNFECREQILKRLSYFCARNIANINGLSIEKLRLLSIKFGIFSIADLYNLDYDLVSNLDNFGKISTANLQISIEKSRQIKAEKFLAGLGIDGIGVENAKLICQLILKNITQNKKLQI